jgi:chaperone modulatory protein CbpM
MTAQSHPAQLIGFILEEQTELSLQDLCRACEVQPELIIELVHEGVLAPAGHAGNAGDNAQAAPEHWHFSGVHLHRARVALRLQNDLGVNLAGAALALELLDELEQLRMRLYRLEGK